MTLLSPHRPYFGPIPILALAAIGVWKEGRLERWWGGRDFARMFRELRNIRWGLTGPSMGGLNEAKDASSMAYLYVP